MDAKIIKIASWMLSNFFLLILLQRLFVFINVDLHISQIMSVAFLIGGFCCFRKIGIHRFDIVVIIYLLYMILNGLMIDYNHHGEFLYRALLAHVFPVMCYFIGRYTQIDIGMYLERMKWPILFAMICGIAFFYLRPSWYVAMKEMQIKEFANEMSISGVYRLSSFWGHPYILAYATFLYAVFITNKLVQGGLQRKEMYFTFFANFVCFIVLLLAQLRVTIVIYALCIVYMIFFSKYEPSTKKVKKILAVSFCFIYFAFMFLQFAADNMDYITNHMLNLTEDNSMSDRFEHTAGGINTYSLFGDGLGRYGFSAREHGMWAIVDHEFQCHLAELGYLGVAILYVIMLFSCIRCIRRPHLVVENSIILFFFVAMLGASVLSNAHQYNYIYWYTLGVVWSYGYKKHVKQ